MKKIFILILILGLFGLGYFYAQKTPTRSASMNTLDIPKLIDSREVSQDIELSLQNSEHEFYPGVVSATKGFSQSYLGPTIRLYEGEDTRIRFTNELREDTSVHHHGLHVAGEIDGGPQNVIKPGDTWDITIPVRQEASTNWYHPHLHGTTAKQVHAGLAGMYII